MIDFRWYWVNSVNHVNSVNTWIRRSCSMYFSPFAKQNQAEVWPRFQSLLKLLLWTKGVEWVKVLNALAFVPLAMYQDHNFWDWYWNSLWDKIIKSITCISLENDISIARTFLGQKFLRTIPRLFLRPKFSRPIPRLFLRPKFSRPIPRLFFETKYFRDWYGDFFSRLNIFETDTGTFFWD